MIDAECATVLVDKDNVDISILDFVGKSMVKGKSHLFQFIKCQFTIKITKKQEERDNGEMASVGRVAARKQLL